MSNEHSTEDQETQGAPMISLALSPWEVFRALEALEGSSGYVALEVAAKLREAAPHHLAALADLGEPCPLPSATTT